MPPGWVHTKNPFRFQVLKYRAKQCHTRQRNRENVLFPNSRNSYFPPKISCTPNSTKIQLTYAESSSNPLSTVKKHQNTNQPAKKIVALGFRRIVEFVTFFERVSPTRTNAYIITIHRESRNSSLYFRVDLAPA